MHKNEFIELASKIAEGTASDQEVELYNAYYNFFQRPAEDWEGTMGDKTETGKLLKILIDEKIDLSSTRRSIWPRIAAAASVILALSAGAYFITYRYYHQKPTGAVADQLLPGSNKAVLTLANGSKLSLTDAGNGSIAHQSNVSVIKNKGGQLVYQVNSQAGNGNNTELYNTVVTPRGGQYSLKLSDGTLVTLDAQSSIRFPVAFIGTERKVEITGQAYFEVVHDPARRFSVIANGQTIEDIGTHFNLNAYTDEPAAVTTLLEGKIKVNWNAVSLILNPGQQAVQAAGKLVRQPADIEKAVAWKDGLFHFSNADLQSVMRQFSRWYNVDVVYKGVIPEHDFNGTISRNVKASEIFELLHRYQINAHLEGHQVIVTAEK